MKTPAEEYNAFYGNDGWSYDPAKERQHLQDDILTAAAWPRGGRVLEIGCGMGLHAFLLHEMGYEVTAVDLSEEGIRKAAKRFQGPRYLAADLAKYEPVGQFDGILSHGMSWFHYELTAVNCNGIDVPKETARLFTWLKSGGTFVLEIKTDFSGRRPAKGVHFNRFSDYVDLFQPLGQIVSITDSSGRPLRSERDARPTLLRKLLKTTHHGVIIATRKR